MPRIYSKFRGWEFWDTSGQMGGSDILWGFSLRQLKKLLATRELAFEIIQQRKQAYWELGALSRMTRDREENVFANRSF